MRLEKEKLKLRKLLLTALALLSLSACKKDITLTPSVPDFQLQEARKYPTVSAVNPVMGEPQIVPITSVDGQYCFPKEEIARILKEWQDAQNKGVQYIELPNVEGLSN